MAIVRVSEAPGYFRVTAEAVTAESCEHGDAAERGWLDRFGGFVDECEESAWDLRDLADSLGRGYRPEGDGDRVPRWLTFEASQDDLISPCDVWGFLGDDYDGEEAIGGTVSVHRPGWITDGSWLRVCRLLGWRPYRG